MLLPMLLLSTAGLGRTETVLGVYIFQRHGDRTPKVLAPAQLTDLGYAQMFLTGNYFRERYVSAGSSRRISGVSTDFVELGQLAASAPDDDVIQTSGLAFLQGLYPPVGSTMATETLRNGSSVLAPLNGYQLIPIQTLQAGQDSENNPWLQSTTSCSKAVISSNNFFSSAEYQSLLSSTKQFILTDAVMQEPLGLANSHEFNLAYNASDPIRAIAGKSLAGQVLTALNETVMSPRSALKVNIQFGSYATFLSYFGLVSLPLEDGSFYGMPDYASSMVWELVTNATTSDEAVPSASDIKVRFLFHNGTSETGATDLQPYPLFNQGVVEIPWSDFVDSTSNFAVSTQQQWCEVCGDSTGACASVAQPTPSIQQSSSSGGMSLAVAGVIGAVVTLAVIVGLASLIMLIFGIRPVRKSRGKVAGNRMSGRSVDSVQDEKVEAA
ncbi:putative histidine acid phosphatase [Aspergillus udagawae]|nr:putative histidine acid phosphatase [Aspergillus udagawae]